jgi:pyruvate-formate lyase
MRSPRNWHFELIDIAATSGYPREKNARLMRPAAQWSWWVEAFSWMLFDPERRRAGLKLAPDWVLTPSSSTPHQSGAA